jgi:L-alanine-DL-glutamate epimerase-like enolase superfamily enzyme
VPSVKIQRVRAWSADLGITKPYTIAYKTVDSVRNAFVEISLENGISGFGSANPSKQVVGEDLDGTLGVLSPENLTFLQGRNIDGLGPLLDEVRARFPKNPGARAALDIALHDALARHLRVPLVKYLGQKITSLPTSKTIGILDVPATLKEAEECGGQGFRILKIKLGNDLDEDIERLIKLRERFGDRFVLRVDANQGYTFGQTVEFYRRTRALEIELIEQPLPARAVEELRRLPPEIRAELAADESLLSPEDALKLLRPEAAVKIFNVKLMKCGGIGEAMKIAKIAAAENIDLFWGCNDESVIGITAALHAAFACVNTKYLDLDGSFDLSSDVAHGGFILRDGVMSCSEEAGLGVELRG